MAKKKKARLPRIGDVMLYFPCVECDAGTFVEADRPGCLAHVVNVLKRGLVSLTVTDRQGRTSFRECVAVGRYDPDCSLPHCYWLA